VTTAYGQAMNPEDMYHSRACPLASLDTLRRTIGAHASLERLDVRSPRDRNWRRCGIVVDRRRARKDGLGRSQPRGVIHVPGFMA